MTARRPASTGLRTRAVARTVAGNRPAGVRAVTRLTSPTPPLRRSEPDYGPSHSDVLALWEDLEWWSCAYCDRPFGPLVACQVDHITPLAKGGLHIVSNLAPSCEECNRRKSDTDIDVWITVLAGQSVTPW